MKFTLLQIVQKTLSDMDSEDVNSISDTVEAQQVASIVEDVFNNMIATKVIPEHKGLLKLTPATDSAYPTHFNYPENVKEVTDVWYEHEDGLYRCVEWVEPLEFLYRIDGIQEDYDTVLDKNGGTNLRIRNSKDPTFYTSFDDYYIVMNSYKSTVDSTLQSSKVRAYGTTYPVFQMVDSYVPEVDATMFPYLLAECKSAAMSLLKGVTDPKVEQAARRQKAFMQNDMYRTKRPNNWSNYGRS